MHAQQVHAHVCTRDHTGSALATFHTIFIRHARACAQNLHPASTTHFPSNSEVASNLLLPFLDAVAESVTSFLSESVGAILGCGQCGWGGGAKTGSVRLSGVWGSARNVGRGGY